MEVFVNRNKELALIDDALDTLIESRKLLRTPIIGFYGMSGIGKTMLLGTIVKRCNEKQLHLYDIKSVPLRTSQLFVDVAKEIEKLLGNGEPVIVILDDWDTTHSEHLREIEATLSDLADDSNLLIILTSKSKDTFDKSTVMSRKITRVPLQPLDQTYCESYIDLVSSDLDSDTRHIIFEWTHGYPIAIKVMIDAIHNEKFNLQREQDQKQLLSIIFDKVIDQSLLARIQSDSKELSRFHRLFHILSVPRRFNLILIQKLIERFAPEYKLRNSMAYTKFPLYINAVTPAIDWNQERAGYCIDGPMRNLFLLRARIEQPQLYIEMHKFLAEGNANFAKLVNGLDRIRYLREFFYHLAHYEEETRLREIVVQHIEQLIPVQTSSGSVSPQVLDNLLQFYEEFQHDGELKEILKLKNVRFIIYLMRKNFIETYARLPIEICGNYLFDFFLSTSSMKKNENSVLIFEVGIRRIMREEAVEVYTMFYRVLSQDQVLRRLLGEDFERVLSLFADSSSEEE